MLLIVTFRAVYQGRSNVALIIFLDVVKVL